MAEIGVGGMGGANGGFGALYVGNFVKLFLCEIDNEAWDWKERGPGTV